MFNKNTFRIAGAITLGSLFWAGLPCGAETASGDDEFRVMSMGADPEEKPAAARKGAAARAGDWEGIIEANNYNKLTANSRQIKKAEFAEDFDTDLLDPARQLDWYGASEDCADKGGLPDHKALLKAWETDCMESTSAVCSAFYWTSEKKGDMALAVNFLNGRVAARDLEAFAYFRCAGGRQARAAARPSRAKAGKKKGPDTSARIVDLVRNYRPVPEGPRLDDKLAIMVAGAGGSYGAVSWEVRKKAAGLYSAAAAVPVSEGEIRFTFSVNAVKKTVAPADARARALFKAITDPDVADGDMR